ncbi:STAS domain-containing protein [Streptomyces sp. TBY4]|uniref:STAS domain-containing protein n=1 Tax=Streptomyces sp. TBY4 TaxID=2962030 RepID=UPI0020B6E1AE|nr:STAS domain-containing protein [Streptomyces sp. TBY4]MCP3754582.1 STAS domain-containing protein [Streptomyces sp. TBY4]
MLPFNVTESGVLIIRLRADLDIADRATAAWAVDGYLAAHPSAPVMLELSDAPLSTAALSTVVRTHHMCRSAGAQLTVVTAASETRRTLETQTGSEGLVIQPSRSLAATALSAARAPAAAAA